MDVNKNSYTFVFSAILVVVVAGILAFVSESLKPLQKENVRIEKMQNILASVGMESTTDDAGEKFDQYIVDQKILNSEGDVMSSSEVDPFDIDVVQQYKAIPAAERQYPLFIFEEGGARKYIVPLAGKGLWGPIWGYISFEEDMNTVYGTTFDHKSETPGLGAEINTDPFQDKFIGKTIFDQSGEFISVNVVKGGVDVSGEKHKVDGISGGTITSKGVGEMIDRTLKVYVPHFKGNKQAAL
ncbi:MAG: NADH:ubiquinone reductase (Na(+)-transporting) subunit C [Vicingaceae bacterium]